MPHKIKSLIIVLLTTILCHANWETIGGNSQRTSFLDVVGPESKDDILWEGSLPSPNICALPILISCNKLVTCRAFTWEDAPIVCHDLFTGDTLWTRDFVGEEHSTSIPLGFHDNIVYAANWYSDLDNGDTLYALNASNGEIIWQSEMLILGIYTQGIAFTDNNDLIIATPDSVTRISHQSGKRLWSVKRVVPVTPSYDGLTIFDNTIYGWYLGLNNELRIIAMDITDGSIKYSVEIPTTYPPFILLDGPLIVIDKQGTLYAYRANDNLSAIKDNGDSLTILWTITIRNGGYSKPATAPLGKVYFTNHNRIMCSNSENGIITDSSVLVNADTTIHLNGHFTIDGNGTVFFNNNNYYNGVLYSFTRNLNLNWIDSIKGIGFGGPALSKHGLLAIAGADNLLRVYKPINLKTNKISSNYLNQETSFEISPHFITFKYYVQYNTNVKLLLYNLKGQTIYSRNNLPDKLGFNTIRIEDSNFNFINGTLIYKLHIGSEAKTNTLHIVK